MSSAGAAETVYGASVRRDLAFCLERFSDESVRRRSLTALAIDDETGKNQGENRLLWNLSLCGALFAELQLQGRLVSTGADAFTIRTDVAPLTGTLGLAEQRLTGRRPRNTFQLLQRLASILTKLRWRSLEELVELGALRREADTLLRIPWRYRWPTEDGTAEQTVVEHLRHWVFTVDPSQPPAREDLLLSLLRVNGLYDSLLSEAEQRQHAQTLDDRTRRAPIGRSVVEATRRLRAT